MAKQEFRQIGVCLFADMQGYSAMMRRDEAAALDSLNKFKQELEKLVSKHQGKIISFYGDGCLALFHSARTSLQCATDLQLQFQRLGIDIRLGLHMGEVIHKENNIFGDSVNISSRIESMGQPGVVLFSKALHDQVRNNPDFPSVSMGTFLFKNIDEAIEVFALKAEGLKIPMPDELQGKFETTAQSPSIQKRKNLLIPIAGLLLLLALFFFYNRTDSASPLVALEKSIAILPFDNLSNDQEQAIYSMGIAEDILTQLSNSSDLRVISHNSSKRYFNSTKSNPQIADELKTKHLLRGSIRRVGQQFRVNVQLIDASKDRNIWGKQFNKRPDDLFDIQSEIALKVIHSLNARMLPDAKARIHKKPTTNLEAYEHYYKATFIWNDRTKENLEKAIQHFQTSIALDSSFALGFAGLSQAYYLYASHHSNSKDWKGSIEKIKTAAEQAIHLDPQLAESYVGLAKYYENHPGELDRKKAIELYQRAVSLRPSYALAHHWLGFLYNDVGWTAEAYKAIKLAHELDPYSTSLRAMLAETSSKIGDTTTAVQLFREELSQNPGNVLFTSLFLEHYIAHQQYAEAFAIAQLLPTELGVKTNQIKIWALSGKINEAKSLMASLDSSVYNEQTSFKPWEIRPLKLHTHLLDAEGRLDELFDILQSTAKRRLGWMQIIVRFPYSQAVRADARYEEVLKAARLWVEKEPAAF